MGNPRCRIGDALPTKNRHHDGESDPLTSFEQLLDRRFTDSACVKERCHLTCLEPWHVPEFVVVRIKDQDCVLVVSIVGFAFEDDAVAHIESLAGFPTF